MKKEREAGEVSGVSPSKASSIALDESPNSVVASVEQGGSVEPLVTSAKAAIDEGVTELVVNATAAATLETVLGTPETNVEARVEVNSIASVALPVNASRATENVTEASFVQKNLDSLQVEISRAEAEDDEETARQLRQQYEKLLVQHQKTSGEASDPKIAYDNGVAGEGTVGGGNETDEGQGATSGMAVQSDFTLEKDDEHINEVCKGRLFIGDITAAVDGKRLSAAGVTHVVDLANTICGQNRPERNVNYVIPRDNGDWADSCPNVTAKLVVKVDDVDEAPLGEHFDAINDFIRNAIAAGGVVFVHCFRGKSRSATSVIQYLMQVDGMTLRAALKAVQEGKCFVYSPPTYCKFDQVDSIILRKNFCSGRYKARPCIQLNIGFRKILMDLERRLRPDEEPSIKLKLTSRKPVLSSSRRPQKTKDVAKASES